MVRIIGIALVILGLLAQPLLAAVPDYTPFNNTSAPAPMEHDNEATGKYDHNAMNGDQATKPPCHEAAAEEAAPMSCTDCESDCTSGACASACSLGTLVLLNESSLNFEHLTAVRVISASGALVQALPSRIFHPPKHA